MPLLSKPQVSLFLTQVISVATGIIVSPIPFNQKAFGQGKCGIALMHGARTALTVNTVWYFLGRVWTAPPFTGKPSVF